MDAVTGRTFASEATRGYRADIDGLRAVAVVAVVLFHAGVPGSGGGFVGVDVFFVISGFLIGGIVDREIEERRFGFVAFYLRRARRIVPALLTVTGTTLGLGLVRLSPSELARFGASVVAALGRASNVCYWQSSRYFTADARVEPFLMTWSLGVEEQFYLLLPPLMLGLSGWGARTRVSAIAVLTLASFALSVVATPRWPVEAFFLLPTRAWELGLGVSIAVMPFVVTPSRVLREALGLLGFVAIVVSICRFDETMRFPGYAASLPAGGTALLIFARGNVVNRRLLAPSRWSRLDCSPIPGICGTGR